MLERFTDRARKVLQLANQEAQRFCHEYIGTEHILLGLVKEGSGVAANVLKNLDIDLRKVRLEVEKLVQSGPDMLPQDKLPQTPRAKKVMELAVEEARLLRHNYVGTEHILLGLLRENEGVAAQVLLNLGLSLQEVREEVLTLLGHGMKYEKRDPREGAVWLVFRYLGMWAEPLGMPKPSIAFHGVFATEEEALAACKNECYFIAPALIGEVFSQRDDFFWPGAYYPLRDQGN